MMISKLPKDSQELTKTKGTIWKPLIAASLLPIFSFTAGQYFPYVIAAVSGSGAIVAVPLAIFAVFAVVALASAIHLITLTVSRADNKKEAGLDREEPSHIASQELVYENYTNLASEPIGKEPVKQDSGPQTEARGSEHVENDTNLENKSSVPTPTPPPVTLGTQPSVSVPPPPPLPSNTPPPPPLAPCNTSLSGPAIDKATMLEQIRQGTKLRRVDDESGTAKKLSNNVGEQKEDLIDDLQKKLAQRRNGASGKPGSKTQQSYNWTGVLSEMSAMIPPRSRSNSVSSSSSAESEQGWSDEENECSTPQSDGKKRSKSPDSNHKSGDDGEWETSPDDVDETTFPITKKVKFHSCWDSSSPTKVNNVESVNSEVQEPSALSFKNRCRIFSGVANKHERSLVPAAC